MNIILIDLRSFNHVKLKELSEYFEFSEDVLFMFKNNDIAKIWVNIENNDVIAYTMKKNPQIQIGHEFMEKLDSMTAFKLPKKIKDKSLGNVDVLDLDSLLDKISKLGINSLSIEEKYYLDKISK